AERNALLEPLGEAAHAQIRQVAAEMRKKMGEPKKEYKADVPTAAAPAKIDGNLRTKTLPILESAAKEGSECFEVAFAALSPAARYSVQNDYPEIRKRAEK